MLRTVVAIVIVFSFVAVCSARETPCKRNPNTSTMQEWFAHSAAGLKGSYEASQHRQKQILEGYGKLKLGQSISETESTIGEPDFEDVYSTFNARVGNRPVEHPRCGWEREYYLEKTGDNFGNLSDRYVHLLFNSEQKLIWIKPQNIKGLTEKGSPE